MKKIFLFKSKIEMIKSCHSSDSSVISHCCLQFVLSVLSPRTGLFKFKFPVSNRFIILKKIRHAKIDMLERNLINKQEIEK